ncbi:hypothetical protein SERLA73DRAFT_189589 [Serpula lacrymans var. lacrymans S7.3]|uniref:Uncharacterized protein n=2 Tax=Serpula lacrymans var. lacrymans TaxID=341189 RepID=F8QDZ8_SERL3|nr:uncharacterized protein SERLADRAFT_480458 [Serpula lacrymans var. lacrymans S7.9]EGN93373.1 hypothetical protein SERLA73DRAFT_189589 [Serpula lacrymans var. lacrymans S7.3]EGO18756.1 hypothetical protein SERLADRAFT_480458 [Serpula lacrymans var. lacrymans S7.9]
MFAAEEGIPFDGSNVPPGLYSPSNTLTCRPLNYMSQHTSGEEPTYGQIFPSRYMLQYATEGQDMYHGTMLQGDAYARAPSYQDHLVPSRPFREPQHAMDMGPMRAPEPLATYGPPKMYLVQQDGSLHTADAPERHTPASNSPGSSRVQPAAHEST